MYLALACLFLGSFSVGTSEFLVSGLLPEISADLDVPLPTAGLLITAYAFGLIGSPLLSLILGKISKKQALVSALAAFVAGQLICALAPNYAMLMVGRIVAAAGHGAFNGVALVFAVGIAPLEKRGTAIAVVQAGVTIANILGVPLGTFVGGVLGWRAAFWLVLGIAAIAMVAIWLLVVDVAAEKARKNDTVLQFRALRDQKVLTAYGVIVLMMFGFWSLNTFIAPYLTDVAGLDPSWIPLALLGAGACGTIGVFFGGHLVNRHPVMPLAAIFPLLSLIYLIASFAVPGRVWTGIVFNCMLWLVATVWIAPAQARVVVGAGTAPELASTLIASVFSVGIALGAWFGGICLARGAELSSLPLIGFASSVVATLLAALAIALDRREGRLARQSVAL